MFDTSKLIPSNLSGKDIYWCDRALPQESPDHPKANVIYVLKSFSEKYELWSAKSDLSGYTPINAKHYNESLSRITPGTGYTSGETYEFSIVNIDSFKTYRTNATNGIQSTLLTDIDGAVYGVSIHIDIGVTSGAFSLNDHVFYLNGIQQIIPTVVMPAKTPLLMATTLPVSGWLDGETLALTPVTNVNVLTSDSVNKTITFTPVTYGQVSIELSGINYSSVCDNPLPAVDFTVNLGTGDLANTDVLPVTIINDPVNTGSDVNVVIVDNDTGDLINNVVFTMPDPAVAPTTTVYVPINGASFPSGVPNGTNVLVTVRASGPAEQVLNDHNLANPNDQLQMTWGSTIVVTGAAVGKLTLLANMTALEKYTTLTMVAPDINTVRVIPRTGSCIINNVDDSAVLTIKGTIFGSATSHGVFSLNGNQITETKIDNSILFPIEGALTTTNGFIAGDGSFTTVLRTGVPRIDDSDSYGNNEHFVTNSTSGDITVLGNGNSGWHWVETQNTDSAIWVTRNELLANHVEDGFIYRLYFKTDDYDGALGAAFSSFNYKNPRYLITKTDVSDNNEIILFYINESTLNKIFIEKDVPTSITCDYGEPWHGLLGQDYYSGWAEKYKKNYFDYQYNNPKYHIAEQTTFKYMKNFDIFAIKFNKNIKFIKYGNVLSFNCDLLKDNVKEFTVGVYGNNKFLIAAITEKEDKLIIVSCGFSGNVINGEFVSLSELPRAPEPNSRFKLSISLNLTKVVLVGAHLNYADYDNSNGDFMFDWQYTETLINDAVTEVTYYSLQLN